MKTTFELTLPCLTWESLESNIVEMDILAIKFKKSKLNKPFKLLYAVEKAQR